MESTDARSRFPYNPKNSPGYKDRTLHGETNYTLESTGHAHRSPPASPSLASARGAAALAHVRATGPISPVIEGSFGTTAAAATACSPDNANLLFMGSLSVDEATEERRRRRAQAAFNPAQQPGFQRKTDSFGAHLTAWHTIHGVCQGPGITVVPVADLVQERELPLKWRPLVKQAAGHCRSRAESACVRKLLQAVRAAQAPPSSGETAASGQDRRARPHSAGQWRAFGLRPPQAEAGSFGPPSPLPRPRSTSQRAQGTTAPGGAGRGGGGGGSSTPGASGQLDSRQRLYATEPSGVGPSGRGLRFPASRASAGPAAAARRPPTPRTPGGTALLPSYGNDEGEEEGQGGGERGRGVALAAADDWGLARQGTRLYQGSGRFTVVPKASAPAAAAPGSSDPAAAAVARPAAATGSAGTSTRAAAFAATEGRTSLNRSSLNRSFDSFGDGATPYGSPPPLLGPPPRSPPLLGLVPTPLGKPVADPPPPLRYGRFVAMVVSGAAPVAAVRRRVDRELGVTQAGFTAALAFAGVDAGAYADAGGNAALASAAPSRAATAAGMVAKVPPDGQPAPPRRPALPPGLMAGIGGGARLKAVDRKAMRDSSAPALAPSSSAAATADAVALAAELEDWVSNDPAVGALPLQHLFRRNKAAAGEGEGAAGAEALPWQRSTVLGAGRYATVAVAAALNNASGEAFAVKEFTFSGCAAPVGVLRAWRQEANALLALDQAAAASLQGAPAAAAAEARPLVVRLLGCAAAPPRLALDLAPLGSLAALLKRLDAAPSAPPISEAAGEAAAEAAGELSGASGAAAAAAAAALRFALACDVAAALAFVHSAGWCHLDVKDHNVVLRRRPSLAASAAASSAVPDAGDDGGADGGGAGVGVGRVEALLADFGTAARLGDAASLTAALRAGAGTSGSAAPELLAAAEALAALAAGVAAAGSAEGGGESAEGAEVAALVGRVGAAADVFSFGVLLWRCLALGPPCANPLAGLHGAAALDAVRRGVRPPWPNAQAAAAAAPMAEVDAAAVVAVGALLQRCWATEPEARPTMADVRTALGEVRWAPARKQARAREPPQRPREQREGGHGSGG